MLKDVSDIVTFCLPFPFHLLEFKKFFQMKGEGQLLTLGGLAGDQEEVLGQRSGRKPL